MLLVTLLWKSEEQSSANFADLMQSQTGSADVTDTSFTAGDASSFFGVGGDVEDTQATPFSMTGFGSQISSDAGPSKNVATASTSGGFGELKTTAHNTTTCQVHGVQLTCRLHLLVIVWRERGHRQWRGQQSVRDVRRGRLGRQREFQLGRVQLQRVRLDQQLARVQQRQQQVWIILVLLTGHKSRR